MQAESVIQLNTLKTPTNSTLWMNHLNQSEIVPVTVILVL